ncbi:hypothetical protein RHSIM_Rhsim10G0029300 [Rhododendron simsii]|uniref:Uncharacterized protein n=1 Tax=Rhododendron simsii TaxID=118357 RepID=A0A834LEJ8_RHOSS|nr:hypothetical protein RHSIM_Rhsim10G0029300 [Rhododendron simsii]
MGGRGRVLRASLGAVLFMAFIWFLFVGVLAHRVIKKTTITTKSSELLKLIGTERHGVKFDCDPYNVSKRRVPNGPNPIHNRKIMSSKFVTYSQKTLGVGYDGKEEDVIKSIAQMVEVDVENY